MKQYHSSRFNTHCWTMDSLKKEWLLRSLGHAASKEPIDESPFVKASLVPLMQHDRVILDHWSRARSSQSNALLGPQSFKRVWANWADSVGLWQWSRLVEWGVGMHSSSSIVFDMCSKKPGAKSTFERFFFARATKTQTLAATGWIINWSLHNFQGFYLIAFMFNSV